MDYYTDDTHHAGWSADPLARLHDQMHELREQTEQLRDVTDAYVRQSQDASPDVDPVDSDVEFEADDADDSDSDDDATGEYASDDDADDSEDDEDLDEDAVAEYDDEDEDDVDDAYVDSDSDSDGYDADDEPVAAAPTAPTVPPLSGSNAAGLDFVNSKMAQVGPLSDVRDLIASAKANGHTIDSDDDAADKGSAADGPNLTLTAQNTASNDAYKWQLETQAESDYLAATDPSY